MLLPSLLLIIFFNISLSHSSNISVNYLGILSHKVDLDPSKVLFVTLKNNLKELKFKPDNYRNGFLNSILDYSELPNNNSIFKLEYSLKSFKFREFYLSFLYENDFYFEFGLNSIPVLKFFIGNLIMKYNLKKNCDDNDFNNLNLRGFKSFGTLVSYYYGFLLEMKDGDLNLGRHLESSPGNKGDLDLKNHNSGDSLGDLNSGDNLRDNNSGDNLGDHNSGDNLRDHNLGDNLRDHNSSNPEIHNSNNPEIHSSILYFCDKFLNYFLHFRNLKHSYSTPDSLLRDHYVDALYCAIDFFNLSKNNNEDDLDFINNYNFEEESSIFVVKYLLIKIKEGFCDEYEFLDKDFNKINENYDYLNREILDHKDLEKEPLPLLLNKLENNNLNNILLLKKDINRLGIKYVSIKGKGKEIRINLMK